MSRDRPSPEPTLEAFDRHRQLLFSIAYRMLGSVADAEDVMQESYLRWRRASEREVRSPKAYLSTVVTRLCLANVRTDGRDASATSGRGCPSRWSRSRTP